MALNCDPAALVAAADSVSFCLSKGLCAPVGSLVVGNREFIARARRVRKVVGGGMRQVGVLAAAGLVALDKMTLRLGEDHATARLLAEGLAEIPQIEIDLAHVQTNMVFFSLRQDAGITAPALVERLRAHNILILSRDQWHFRAVTHYWIRREHIVEVLDAIKKELG